MDLVLPEQQILPLVCLLHDVEGLTHQIRVMLNWVGDPLVAACLGSRPGPAVLAGGLGPGVMPQRVHIVLLVSCHWKLRIETPICKATK